MPQRRRGVSCWRRGLEHGECGGERGISPPAGGKVASRPSRAARRQHMSRRRGASAGQTGARGVSAGGAGAGGSEARCHVRGRRGRGLDHAISKRPATQRGGGAGPRSGVCDPAGRKLPEPHGPRSASGGGGRRRHPSPQAAVRSRRVSTQCLPGGQGTAQRGGERHILHDRGVPETARSKTGSASSISHRQWRIRLTQEGSLGKQGTAGRPVLTVADYTVPAG